MNDFPGLVTLRNAEAELILAPEIGGSVVAFRFRGEDVLRPGAMHDLVARNPRGMAAFPLFPFSGRIAEGRFRCGAEEIALPANFPPEPHAIHGQAWQNPWHPCERDNDAIRLVYEHDVQDEGPGWPWAYRAEQRFELTGDGLRLSLDLTNRSERSMPAGLGWHPYFPKWDAKLKADVERIWPSADDMIPEGPSPLDDDCNLTVPRSVSTLRLDDAFSAGEAGSVIEWPARKLRVALIASAPLRHLVVFTPAGEEHFCVEPTSHAPDAVNSPLPAVLTGYRELAPGGSLSAKIDLEVRLA